MVQICSKCSRANPEDACYCYFDGFVLGHGSRNGGPVAVGAQAFAQPFVFPTGRTCRNFDELALACQEEWSSARDLLGQGYLESFFGGLGRIDLVMAAKEASKFPDHDRGLDELLAKMPSDVLAGPQLGVETHEVNLGVVKVGTHREFTIHLENKGMRLLHGTISCTGSKDAWLTLSDAPGTIEKHFQFGGEQTIKVKVVGDRLRANVKPQEARLVIASNGGKETIVVRAEVPVTPFPSGVLGSSNSPRELAMKAKKHIKEAAPCFERGEVEQWYRTNGWNYPVQGPVFSGIHAIQQFFEALGLVKPPPVEIDTQTITWSANPGERLACEIKVESPEKKPVFAYATSDQPWIQPEKAKLTGRTASISIVVPAVPSRPGKTLSARLTVMSNGNQRFEVPVSLAVAGNPFDFNGAAADEPAVVEAVAEVEPVAAVAVAAVAAVPPVRSEPTAVTVPPAVAIPKAAPQVLEAVTTQPSASSGRSRYSRRRATGVPLWMHLTPAVLLGVALLGVVIFDLVKPLAVRSNMVGDGPSDNHTVTYSGEQKLTLEFHRDRYGSFGIQSAKEKDPTEPNRKKRLTYDNQGSGDNVIVRLDGRDYYYHLATRDRPTRAKHLPKPRIGLETTKTFLEFNVEIDQHVELVSGTSGARDTVLVYYTITNKSDNTTHKVGLRAMMDTFIGANDGVPFTIPGKPGFLTTMKEFSEKEVPDYIEAIERPDHPDDLGTIVRMGLRHIKVGQTELEPIHKMRICHYPGSQAQWDWEPMEPIVRNERGDSCVALYWAEITMNPGDVRMMGYTYGLSELSLGAGDTPIALSAPATVQPNSEFVLTAYVWNARPGQTITVELPEGLTLASGETETKDVDDPKRARCPGASRRAAKGSSVSRPRWARRFPSPSRSTFGGAACLGKTFPPLSPLGSGEKEMGE